MLNRLELQSLGTNIDSSRFNQAERVRNDTLRDEQAHDNALEKELEHKGLLRAIEESRKNGWDTITAMLEEEYNSLYGSTDTELRLAEESRELSGTEQSGEKYLEQLTNRLKAESVQLIEKIAGDTSKVDVDLFLGLIITLPVGMISMLHTYSHPSVIGALTTIGVLGYNAKQLCVMAKMHLDDLKDKE